MAGEVTSGLRSLLARLRTFKVDWKFSFVPTEDKVYEPGIDREVVDLSDANVVSSLFKSSCTGGEKTQRHAVLLDIDYPAHLVASSTPDHYHLYLEPPGGVEHEKYMNLLAVLRDCGIIEKGYADVSIARGHSDLRLPWVTKADQVLHKSGEEGVDLKGVDIPPTPTCTIASPLDCHKPVVDFDDLPF
jgi:hypothetical protein